MSMRQVACCRYHRMGRRERFRDTAYLCNAGNSAVQQFQRQQQQQHQPQQLQQQQPFPGQVPSEADKARVLAGLRAEVEAQAKEVHLTISKVSDDCTAGSLTVVCIATGQTALHALC